MAMDLAALNARVDQALSRNARAEYIIIALSAAIFLLGVGLLAVSYVEKNPYVATGSLLLQGFLYWPIQQIRQLRRENIMLQTVPAVVAMIDPVEAAKEIRKMLDFIRKGKA